MNGHFLFGHPCSGHLRKWNCVMVLISESYKILSLIRLIVLTTSSGDSIGKLQERIVFKNMYNFLLDNNLLYKYQSGFLPHHSTVFQLIDIFHNICQAFDNNMFSCIVFCDVSKAFDRAWHKGLLRVFYLSYGKMALKGNS